MFDLFSQLFQNPLLVLLRVFSVLAAITIHEFCHGLAADRMGDPTPRINDRLSLNPIKHLDPVGTIALFFLGIGWAKPVPIDPFNFQNKKRDTALVSLAGPASNLLTALIASLTVKYILPLTGMSINVLFLISTLIFPFIAISVGLAVFNLLPIPPLDGSKIFFALLPNRLAYEWEEVLEKYGLIILMFLLFPLFGNSPLVMKILSPVITFVLNLLL